MVVPTESLLEQAVASHNICLPKTTSALNWWETLALPLTSLRGPQPLDFLPDICMFTNISFL